MSPFRKDDKAVRLLRVGPLSLRGPLRNLAGKLVY